MKMTERIQRNMQRNKPMTLISLRLPTHVIDDLKEIAPTLGFGGYQALIRAYISNGLRQHLSQRCQASREQRRRGTKPQTDRPRHTRASDPASSRRDAKFWLASGSGSTEFMIYVSVA